MTEQSIEAFIVRAKAACYIGGGAKVAPSRPGAQDLAFSEGPLSYRDSYFGGTDFLGQEAVWQGSVPVWAMNYYGHILRDDLLDGSGSGAILKAALSALYREGRFLGGFSYQQGGFAYHDESTGDWRSFLGHETISKVGVLAYRLDYSGGLIRP
jgi:hypothetical protein